MTPERRKTKILLLEQGNTFTDLASATGLTEATIHNVLDGVSSSAKSRLAITNALGAQIFDGIFPTEMRHLYRAGVVIAFPGHPELAELWRINFPDRVRVSGEQITFLKNTVLKIRIEPLEQFESKPQQPRT